MSLSPRRRKGAPDHCAPGAAPAPGAPDLRPAVHESGHALVAHLAGLPVYSVAVEPVAATRHGYSGPDAALRDHLAVKVAGIAAEYVAGYVRVIRGGADLLEADKLAQRLTADPHAQLDEVGAALRRAIDLLTVHRGALRSLALTVHDRGAIRGQSETSAALDAALEARHA